MHFNFNQLLLNQYNKPFLDMDPAYAAENRANQEAKQPLITKEWTFADVLVELLMRPDADTSGGQRVQRGALALKLLSGATDYNAEEITQLKNIGTQHPSPIICVRIENYIESATTQTSEAKE